MEPAHFELAPCFLWFGAAIAWYGVQIRGGIPRQNGFEGQSHVVRGHFSPPRSYSRAIRQLPMERILDRQARSLECVELITQQCARQVIFDSHVQVRQFCDIVDIVCIFN